MSLGYPVMIDNMGETIKPPSLEPIVYKAYQKVASNYTITIGDRVLDISSDFRLYLICK